MLIDEVVVRPVLGVSCVGFSGPADFGASLSDPFQKSRSADSHYYGEASSQHRSEMLESGSVMQRCCAMHTHHDIMFVEVGLRWWRALRVPIIQPNSKGRILWLMFSFVFIMYEVFSVPLSIAFDFQPAGIIYACCVLMNIYFLVDIVVSFLTGYVDPDGAVVMAPQRIWQRFATTWLVPDLIAGIPWDMMQGFGMNRFRFLRAVRLVRLMKLFKLWRTQGFTGWLETLTQGTEVYMLLVSVGRVTILLAAVTHWAACTWHIVGEHSGQDQTWLDTYLGDDTKYGDGPYQHYLVAVYFTLMTMTTVGFGDITPQNLTELGFVLVLLLVASFVFAGLMGVLTDIISNMSNESHNQAQKKTMLNRYMAWRAVPNELTKAIRNHLYFVWETNGIYSAFEEEVKSLLSPGLKAEVSYHIFGRIIHRTPCFGWMKDYSMCVRFLSCKAQSSFYEQGDHLFKMGEPSEQIIVMLLGSVWVTQNDTLHLGGDYVKSMMWRGASTFAIPRNRQVGLVDVGRRVLKRTKEALFIQRKENEDKALNVLRMFNNLKDIKAMEEQELIKSFKCGVIRGAVARMELRDNAERKAAQMVQLRWRRRLKIRQSGEEDFGSQRMDPKLCRKSMAEGLFKFKSTMTHAPAYFGESCLWTPIEHWGTVPPLPYKYTARCETRVEFVVFPRSCVLETIEHFSPWLPERLKCFQKFVLEGFNAQASNTDPITFHRQSCASNGLHRTPAKGADGTGPGRRRPIDFDWSFAVDDAISGLPPGESGPALSKAHLESMRREA